MRLNLQVARVEEVRRLLCLFLGLIWENERTANGTIGLSGKIWGAIGEQRW